MELELKAVADDLGFPEGPVAMSDGSVLFVDIEQETLVRVPGDGSSKPVTVAKLPGGPNGVAIGPDGAAYVCNNGGVYRCARDKNGLMTPYPNTVVYDGKPEDYRGARDGYVGGSIQRVDLDTGDVTVLYREYDRKRLLAPDDIVFDAEREGFWFTETGIQDEQTLHKGAVYYATTDGETLERVATIPMPNGIGLSPKGDTLYVSDTIFGRLWAMKITGPGQVEPGPVKELMPGNVVQTLPGFQWLDSLKVEESGKICVATLIKGGITVFSPDGETEHVEVPDPYTTNLCFGGDDMRDVWITASGTGKIYRARWPRPGLKLAYNA